MTIKKPEHDVSGFLFFLSGHTSRLEFYFAVLRAVRLCLGWNLGFGFWCLDFGAWNLLPHKLLCLFDHIFTPAKKRYTLVQFRRLDFHDAAKTV